MLARLKAAGDWLLGDQLTLADLHAAPMFGYFVKAPEGRALLAELSATLSALVGARRARSELPAALSAADRS